MHRKPEVKDRELFEKIKEISNPSKFRILELIQGEKSSVTGLAKKVNLAFNKCSNYCAELEKKNLILKEKEGKNVFVKGKINLKRLGEVLS